MGCKPIGVGSIPTCGSIFRRQNEHESLQKTNDKIQKQNISLAPDFWIRGIYVLLG